MYSNLMSKTIIAVTAAVVLGAGALSPAAAQTSRDHMRAAPYAQSQAPYAHSRATYDAYNAYNQFGDRSGMYDPSFNFGQGTRCVTDEGYGRYSYCDTGNN